MGVFSVRIEVGSPIDPVFSEMDLLVDTGADFSMLPTSLLEGALGLSPTEGDRETFELADGVSVNTASGKCALGMETGSEPPPWYSGRRMSTSWGRFPYRAWG